jgi:lysozyme
MNGETYTKLREGLTLVAVKDSRGWEIGYGHNSPDIGDGTTWTEAQAEAQFATDYAKAQRNAALVLGSAWPGLDYVRRCALTDMAYELGGTGLAQFHHMLLAIGQGAWDTAQEACLDSAYAKQVPARAAGAAHMLATGTWPEGFGS